MDKTALLKAIKEAEAKAASDLEEAQARKQQALAAAQSDAERTKRDAFAAVDKQAADQVAEARRRIEGDKAEKLAAGRAQIGKKRERAEARVAEVADYLVEEFERSVQAGLR